MSVGENGAGDRHATSAARPIESLHAKLLDEMER